MKIGIDVSPLHTGHKVRGIGFYVKRLVESLKNIQNSKGQKFKIKELKSKAEIKRQDYDLLHIPYFDPYFLTLPWPWKIKKPLVVSIHDLIPIKYPEHYPPGIKAKFKWQIQKRLLKQSKLIITDSFASKYDIHELTGYRLDKIYVVYLAAGDEFQKLKVKSEKLKIKRKYNLPGAFALYVGDVNWNKNIPSLVRACEKIDLPLVIVGRQAASKDYDKSHPENKNVVWLQKKYSKFQFSNIQKNKFRLILTGYVSEDDLVALYNLATVYCQPSYDEGFGLPVVEAMACGCPVVSSNQGSLPEVIDEAGILIEPTSENLSEELQKVIRDEKLRKKLSQAGIKRSGEFSWEKAAQKTLEVYKLAVDLNLT